MTLTAPAVEQVAPTGGRRLIAARVEGESHRRAGVGCQDRWSAARCAEGYVVAVADGLGSAPLSALGAGAAVYAAVAEGLEQNERRRNLRFVADSMVSAARRALVDLSAGTGARIADLACTIIAIANRGRGVAVSHVGDGAVVARTSLGLLLVSGPGESEYTEVVDPLSASRWMETTRTSPVVWDVTDVAAFTDGVQPAALRPGFLPHEGFFDPVFDFARTVPSTHEGSREIAALLCSAKVAEFSDDDKTLAVLTVR